MFCKHKWSILSETTTKSKFQSAIDAVSELSIANLKTPHQMCCAERKHIQTFTCDKCGKLKRFVENI